MITIGDTVRYSRNFLRSTGMFTGPIPFAKGIVTGIKNLSEHTALAEIEWNNPEIPTRVNVKNLEKVRVKSNG